MSVQILQGDALTVLKTMPDESVNCCVTSPPYWGLRDYGVDGQLGLERAPEEYVAKMVEVFREVRRVLRDDGTLWLNLGDSYSRDVAKGGSGPNGKHDFIPDYGSARKIMSESRGSSDGKVGRADRAPVRCGGESLKPKDLVGIPWMVAFALRASGWYLRQDIIWNKPNPMPESVQDRCTKAHEYIFLMSKSQRYFYDAEAIKEPSAWPNGPNSPESIKSPYGQGFTRNAKISDNRKELRSDIESRHRSTIPGGQSLEAEPNGTRNRRSVWTVPTFPFPGAHFATFPPKLIEPCILAGCPDKCCDKCGAPWGRLVEKSGGRDWRNDRMKAKGITGELNGEGSYKRGQSMEPLNNTQTTKTIGFCPTCACNGGTRPGTVLDPFGGSGTVGMVAEQHGRNSILIELNPKYIEMAKRRTAQQNIFAGLSN